MNYVQKWNFKEIEFHEKKEKSHSVSPTKNKMG